MNEQLSIMRRGNFWYLGVNSGKCNAIFSPDSGPGIRPARFRVIIEKVPVIIADTKASDIRFVDDNGEQFALQLIGGDGVGTMQFVAIEVQDRGPRYYTHIDR